MLPSGLPGARLGIVASRKMGGAVERNRAKRLIREMLPPSRRRPREQPCGRSRGDPAARTARRGLHRHSPRISATPGAGVSSVSRRTPVDRLPLSLAQRILLAAIRGYQLLFSPMFAGSCRFVPSCSAYAVEAVREHGVLRGSLLEREAAGTLPAAREARVRSGARPIRRLTIHGKTRSSRGRPLGRRSAWLQRPVSAAKTAGDAPRSHAGRAPRSRHPSTAPQTTTGTPAPSPAAPVESAPSLVGETAPRDIVVENDDVRVTFSTRGAVITSWRLKRYAENGAPLELCRRTCRPGCRNRSRW